MFISSVKWEAYALREEGPGRGLGRAVKSYSITDGKESQNVGRLLSRENIADVVVIILVKVN